MRDAIGRGSAVIKALHLEYLVTKQTGTGNGEAWIPLASEGPSGKFKAEELGLAFEHGPSVFHNARGRAEKNRGQLKRHLSDQRKLGAQALKLHGIKPAPVEPPTGCTGCASCAPAARLAPPKRREEPRDRWWRPSDPNGHNRIRQQRARAAELREEALTLEERRRLGSEMRRDRRPVDAKTRRRQLRLRAKAAGIVVKGTEIVREGTTE